jgi:hypothetical protein
MAMRADAAYVQLVSQAAMTSLVMEPIRCHCGHCSAAMLQRCLSQTSP